MAARIKAIVVTLDFSVITNAAYTPFVDSPFPAYQIQVSNLTDQPVYLSVDGATNALILPPIGGGGGPYFSIPFFRNIAWPMPLYVKAVGMNPSTGTIYMNYIGCDEAAWEEG